MLIYTIHFIFTTYPTYHSRVYFLLQQAVISPLSPIFLRYNRPIRKPDDSTQEVCSWCIKEIGTSYWLPVIHLKDIVRFFFRWTWARVISVDKEVTTSQINLQESVSTRKVAHAWLTYLPISSIFRSFIPAGVSQAPDQNPKPVLASENSPGKRPLNSLLMNFARMFFGRW